ncbi:hypothetical protein C6P42_002080, partial [Pichia californica]
MPYKPPPKVPNSGPILFDSPSSEDDEYNNFFPIEKAQKDLSKNSKNDANFSDFYPDQMDIDLDNDESPEAIQAIRVTTEVQASNEHPQHPIPPANADATTSSTSTTSTMSFAQAAATGFICENFSNPNVAAPKVDRPYAAGVPKAVMDAHAHLKSSFDSNNQYSIAYKLASTNSEILSPETTTKINKKIFSAIKACPEFANSTTPIDFFHGPISKDKKSQIFYFSLGDEFSTHDTEKASAIISTFHDLPSSVSLYTKPSTSYEHAFLLKTTVTSAVLTERIPQLIHSLFSAYGDILHTFIYSPSTPISDEGIRIHDFKDEINIYTIVNFRAPIFPPKNSNFIVNKHRFLATTIIASKTTLCTYCRVHGHTNRNCPIRDP